MICTATGTRRRSGQRRCRRSGRIELRVSVLQPSVYYRPPKDLFAVVHVNDFLCSEKMELEWFLDNWAQKFELKKSADDSVEVR